MRNLAHFTLGNIIKKINAISVTINTEHRRPFPKPDCFLLSHYRYERRYIKIDPSGRIEGGLPRMISSLIDFSFIRSIVAHKYRLVGVAYDPVSLFLLELFCHLDKFRDLKTFCNLLHDPVRGKHYRIYAGINDRHIPCQATFSNFKARLGEDLYNRIFHVLVRIVELLGFLSYKIIATDGTLFPSNSRYRGCRYFCRECNSIAFEGIIENARRRLTRRLKDPARLILGKEIRIKVECPFNRIFGLEDELRDAGLDVRVKQGILTRIVLVGSDDTFYFRCPRLPSDLDAKIGVRRNPQNPNRKQKI